MDFSSTIWIVIFVWISDLAVSDLQFKNDRGEILGSKVVYESGDSAYIECESFVTSNVAETDHFRPKILKCQNEYELDGSCGNTVVVNLYGYVPNAVKNVLNVAARYSGSLITSADGDKHTVSLSISDIQEEDNGWYICTLEETPTHENPPVAYTSLWVKEPIESISTNITYADGESRVDTATVTVRKGDQIDYECNVYGGLPRADISVFWDFNGERTNLHNNLGSQEEDNDNSLTFRNNVYYDSKGTKVVMITNPENNFGGIRYELHWMLNGYEPDEHDHGRALVCEAHITSQLDGSIVTHQLASKRTDFDVFWDPIFHDCFGKEEALSGQIGYSYRNGEVEISAAVGDINVVLMCTVNARPMLSQVELQVGDSSANIVMVNDRNNEWGIFYSPSTQAGNSNNVTYMFNFPTIDEAHFSKYFFRVSNGGTLESTTFILAPGGRFVSPESQSSTNLSIRVEASRIPVLMITAMLVVILNCMMKVIQF